MISRVKGTQDFLDLSLYNFLINATRQHFSKAAFTEIATPILEHTELFKRTLGLHTEVISKEMYTVITGHETDISSKETLCLRPEATAPTMRAFFNNNIEKQPWKIFSHGPMFRHERPQKGRFRQFHQVTIEVIGATAIAYDAELLCLLDRFFRQQLHMSSYDLSINFLGTVDDRATYKQTLKAFLDQQKALPEKIIELKEKNIMRVFDLKDPLCQQALEDAPVITDYLSKESEKEWELLQSLLKQLSVPHTLNPRLVRGLDYYNKTVFEFASSHLGAQNAFCGGGRYDHLAQALGEKEPLPSLGAAFGIERMLMILELQKEKLSLPSKPAVQFLMPMGSHEQLLALTLADKLRNHNIYCDVILDTTSLKSMMKKADRAGAQHVIIIGEDEIKNNTVTIKNMVSGNEIKVMQENLVDFFNK
jgi:histidyl-tRNA synthetase